MSDWRKNTRVFYGWWLVAALFAVLFNTGGTGFYVFPVFIAPLQEEFGWTMTQISISAAIWAIFFGFSSPVVGWLIARYGARKTMLTAAVLASLTNLGLAGLQNLWMLYGVNLIAGFVVAGTTLVPIQTLVTNWFNKYRGRAMALAMTGIGAGGFLLPPFNEFLIRLWGWRLTWAFTCIILWLVVIPLIAIFVRTRPSDVGLMSDGAVPGEEAGGETKAVMSGLPVKRAVSSLTFWMLLSVFFLQLVCMSAMNFHFVPFATQEARFSSQQAAFFYGLAIGFSIAGRLLFGWMADRWRPERLMAIAAVLLASGPIIIETLIVRAGIDNVNLLWFYAVPYGIGIGGQAIILPILVGRCFGELNFSKIQGLVMATFPLGITVGIPGAGRVFDITGSYELVFITSFVGLAVSALLVLFVRSERYRAEFVKDSS
ncbi:MAG: MFS transporter [Deltaproteobacteria bacterium]|nr:MAG: MFS transporter [Deltaproteobacteria bacterium]